jgi:uncharacterized membrane protein YcaP (DUF421 family)
MNNLMEILLRSISLFIVSLVFIRLMGKRSLSKLDPIHYVSFTVIAIIAALISVRIITNLVYGFIALAVWIILPIALDFLSLKSKWVHDLVNGKPTILIKQGKIMEENLMQERITGEELLRDLRSKNAFNLADVEFAIMETSGDINVYLKSDRSPITAHDLNIKVAPRTEPQTVILDGSVINEPLSSLGLNQGWLKLQLENMGVTIDNVFIAQVDSSGELYIDLFDDAILIPQPKVKEMLYANFEKSQADLMKYMLETQDESARDMYSKNAEKLKVVMNKLEPYLLR